MEIKIKDQKLYNEMTLKLKDIFDSIRDPEHLKIKNIYKEIGFTLFENPLKNMPTAHYDADYWNYLRWLDSNGISERTFL